MVLLLNVELIKMAEAEVLQCAKKTLKKRSVVELI